MIAADAVVMQIQSWEGAAWELQVSMKFELAVMKGTLERFVEFAAKDSAEHLDGKKEVAAWFDPARVIGRQPTGRHHAMYMRYLLERVSHS